MDHVRLSSLINESKIKQRVQEIGAALSDQLKGKDVVMVGVLKGSFMFYADLIRTMTIELSCDFIGLSSYQNSTASSGEVKVTLDLTRSIRQKHVVVVEDIVDTGLTMNFLRRHLSAHKPASITTVSLLLKPEALKEKCEVEHVGFKIPNDFVVGYGLDYQGYFRNLPYIAQVSSIN
jgi:hypoxanthine phosphoribosyltransferase